MKILKVIFVTLALAIPIVLLILNFAIGLGGFSILTFFAIISVFMLIKGIFDSISQKKITIFLIITILAIIILCAFAFLHELQNING